MKIMPLRRSSRKRTPTKPYVIRNLGDAPNGDGDSGKKKKRKLKIKQESSDSDVKNEYDSPDISDDESFHGKMEDSGIAVADVDPSSSEDDEEGEISRPKNSRQKRGRPSGSSSRKANSKSPKKKRDYGPVSDRTCPFCGKVFSIITGLAYHIERRVCQTPKRSASSISAIGSTPYPVLELGDKFVTTWGVVSVLGDKRVPDDYGRTKITKEIKKAKTIYSKQRDRAMVKRGKLHLYTAKISRKRRAALVGLWNDRYGRRNVNGSKNDVSVHVDAEAYAKKVFGLYCPSSTAQELLSDGDDTKVKILTQKPLQPIPDLGPNPASPLDSYPKRIVECVLIEDKRKRILDTEEVIDGRWSHVDSAIALVEKVQQKSRRNGIIEEENGSDGKEIASGMKIFIRREDLVHRYNPESPVYYCKYCGKDFYSRVGCKNHLDEKVCVYQGEQFEEERNSRLEEVEASLDIVVRPPPSLLPPAPPLPPGQKKRKNAHKLPGWIIFHPNKSVTYPEVFTALKFKRGSNNTKFMHKKWVEIGPGRKKHRKSRAKKTNQAISVIDQVEKWMDCSKLPIYPAVWGALFPTTTETSTPSKRSSSKRAKERISIHIEDIENDGGDTNMDEEYTPEDFLLDNMDIDSPMPPLLIPAMPNLPPTIPTTHTVETQPLKKQNTSRTTDLDQRKEERAIEESQAQTPPPKKKRRRRKSTSPAAPKPFTPIIVDIRPLIEEVNAGRYPSMKAYTGDHLDICFHCKTKDKNVLHCEFCANSEHLSCLQTKVKIRDPEPDDDFMCHRCVQTVMARRARAEKRRLSKLKDTLKAGGNGSDNVDNEVTNTITSPIEQAKIAAARKREIVWSQSEFDAHVATYSKCPTGGPGGLICCRPCAASYSNLLNDTAKEMESQTVSSVGREVSELVELLHDAQVRLKQAVDVSNGNDIRRNILNPNEAGKNEDDARGSRNAKSLMGIMDIFS